jgi:hypothetical protein
VVGTLFWSVALDSIAYRWPRTAWLLKARPSAGGVTGRSRDESWELGSVRLRYAARARVCAVHAVSHSGKV